jgi:hypothetical protein
MDPTVEHDPLATRVSQELQVYLHKGLLDYLPGNRMIAFGLIGALLGLGGSLLVRPAQFSEAPAPRSAQEAPQAGHRQAVSNAGFLRPNSPARARVAEASPAPRSLRDTPASVLPGTQAEPDPQTLPPAPQQGAPSAVPGRVADAVGAAPPRSVPPRKFLSHPKAPAVPGLLVPPDPERRVQAPSGTAPVTREGLLIPPDFASTLPGGK